MQTYLTAKTKLLELIKSNVVISGKKEKFYNNFGRPSSGFILDFKNIFFTPPTLQLIAYIFWEQYKKHYPFQIGGQELAAIPLVSAIILYGEKINMPINGFIIRKSRKPTGLQKIIEGRVNNEKIILIDDIIHSGTTILRQLEILKTVNKKPDFVFTIVDYKKNDNKEMLLKMGVNLQSVYYLNEIIPQDADINESKLNEGFDVMWKFSAPDPNFFHRIHKSTPLLDQNTIFFASDNHTLWSLNKNDGSIQWAFKGFGYPTRSKMTVFSSPAIYNNIIYIASYDGNLYALNKNNGIKKWVYLDADFIGSSPVIADKLNMLFIGIGYGLFNKKGAIVALNAESGKRIWHFNTPNFILSTPYYCREKKIIVVGCDDGVIYAFYAKNGKKLWQFQTEGSVRSFLDYDPKKQIIFAGSFDDYLYGLNINTGELKFKFKTKGPVFSPPLVYENNIYFGSMDKHLYCVNLDTELANWNFDAGGRIFAKPKIVNDKIYIGSTSGILYEIELLTGKALSYFIATERITNEIVFDRKERKFFLSTYANELYCLSKKQKNN